MAKQTRELINLAIINIIGHQGYSRCTATKIAEIVGISKGSLYYYNASQEDMIKEAIEYSMDEENAHKIGDFLKVAFLVKCVLEGSPEIMKTARQLFNKLSKDNYIAKFELPKFLLFYEVDIAHKSFEVFIE